MKQAELFGSIRVSSKFGDKINSLLINVTLDSSSESLLRRASVYLYAAGGSPSSEPKFPCPSIIGILRENVCAILTIVSYTAVSPCGWKVTNYFTNYLCGFNIRPVASPCLLIHCMKNPSMYRFQAIPDIGKSPSIRLHSWHNQERNSSFCLQFLFQLYFPLSFNVYQYSVSPFFGTVISPIGIY